MFKKTLSVGLLLGAIAPVSASNFSYSVLEVALGKATLDDEVVVVDEVYEDFGFFGFGGGYQFAENFALSLSAAGFANEGDDTEWTTSTVSILANFPIPVAPQVDIIPTVGYVSGESEICLGNTCIKEDDSGLGYGIGIRAWAVPGQFEVNAAYANSAMEDSERTIS